MQNHLVLNTVGMQRHGYDETTQINLRRAYKIIYRQGLTVVNAMAELRKMNCPQVDRMIHFIEHSSVGIVR